MREGEPSVSSKRVGRDEPKGARTPKIATLRSGENSEIHRSPFILLPWIRIKIFCICICVCYVDGGTYLYGACNQILECKCGVLTQPQLNSETLESTEATLVNLWLTKAAEMLCSSLHCTPIKRSEKRWTEVDVNYFCPVALRLSINNNACLSQRSLPAPTHNDKGTRHLRSVCTGLHYCRQFHYLRSTKPTFCKTEK